MLGITLGLSPKTGERCPPPLAGLFLRDFMEIKDGIIHLTPDESRLSGLTDQFPLAGARQALEFVDRLVRVKTRMLHSSMGIDDRPVVEHQMTVLEPLSDQLLQAVSAAGIAALELSLGEDQ